MLTRLGFALVVVVAFASGVWADRTITRFTVVLADVTGVCFSRDAQAPNGWSSSASATVRASDGSTYGATISGRVAAAQKTTIETYITNNVLAPLNTQEGL